MAEVAFITFAIFNGLALAFGLYEAVSDQIFVARLVLSIAGGVTIAMMIAIGWRMLLRSAVAGRRDVQTAVLGTGLALSGIVVSAWFLAAIIGGDDARADYQSDHLVVLQAQADRISDNAELDAKVVAATRTAGVEVREMARAEASSGLVSRIAEGHGEWARSLEAFATTLESRAVEMEAQQARREDSLALFGKTMVEARLAASRGEGERYEEMITRGSRLLAEADGIASHVTVAAIGTGLMAKEGREQISAATARLTELADDASTQWRKEDVPFYQAVSKQVATAISADAIPGAWAVAVAFEILPFMLLLIVLLRPEDPKTLDERGGGENDNDQEPVEPKSTALRQVG
ncbi:MAG TPA: hypothetical protein VGB04_04525 [Allosphingosinicella sp.]|jgi:predicted lipoprotein with Yx(FWY)xxD motif